MSSEAGVKQIYNRYLSSGFLVTDAHSKEAFLGYEQNYLEYLPSNKDARILEIGCGTGQFLRFLKEKGYTDFEGIDVGREQVEFCRKYVTENVKQIDNLMQYLQENKDSYETIAMINVVEHLPKDNIVAILELLKDSLKNNGLLLIQTVNMANFSGMRSRYFDFTHEIGFTESSLEKLLKATGFSDVKILGNKLAFKFNVKRIIWLIAQNIWHFMLRIIYVIEIGNDYPRILSKYLIAVAKK